MSRHLDAIIRTGSALDRSLAKLPRCELRALADRLDLPSERGTKELQVSLRRRLVGLHYMNQRTGDERALGGDAGSSSPGYGIASGGTSDPAEAGRDHTPLVVPALPSGGGR